MDFQFEEIPFLSKGSSTSRKAKTILDSLRDGIIISTYGLSDRLNLTRSTVEGIVREIPDYTAKYKSHRVWGNSQTIRELKEKYGE
jgi:hypothetical protein